MKFPVASKKEHINRYHEIDYQDPYFWLREKESDEVLDYLKAENNYFEKVMEPHKDLIEELYQEMVQRTKEDDESVPEKYGPFYYYYRIEKGKNYRIYCRKQGLDQPEEIILDLNSTAEGKKFLSLGTYDISPDQTLIAYTIDYNGHEDYQLFIKKLSTNEIIELSIKDLDGSVNWGPDNSTLFYCKHDEIHRSSYVYKGTIDLTSKTPELKEELLYYEQDETYSTGIDKTKDEKYLIITSHSKETTEVRFLDLSSNEVKIFLERKFSIIYYLYHRKGYFYVITNDKAINFKVLRVKTSDYTDTTKFVEFIPAKDDVKISGLEMFEDFIVCYVRKDGLKNISIFIEESNEWHDIEMPESLHTINDSSSPVNFEFKAKKLRFFYESMKTPKTVYDYDPFSKELILLKQDTIFGNYDPDNYITERKFVKASDGTQIPISIMHLKTLKKNGSQPTYLYGYGSYGISKEPNFNSYMLNLINRGFIFVIAHIRGGGEMGRQWYLDGKYLKKKNTFTDFINVAEYLTSEKYTNPSNLAISGGSAGGLLIGAVINMRPELFKVAKLNVPFVDVINTMMDSTIPLTTFEYEEWGDPNDKVYFDYMLSYSPYDNIEAKNYPHLIVTSGLNDPRVQYWEPTKYVAKLRAMKTDTNDIVYKINMGSGHSGSSGKYNYIKEIAYEQAFILTRIKK